MNDLFKNCPAYVSSMKEREKEKNSDCKKHIKLKIVSDNTKPIWINLKNVQRK